MASPIKLCDICGNEFNTYHVQVKFFVQDGQQYISYRCPYCKQKYKQPVRPVKGGRNAGVEKQRKS